VHPEGDTVRRALYWVACGLIVLNLPLSAGRVLVTPGAYRQGFAPTALLLIVGLLGWALWRCGRGVDAALPLQGLVVVCYVTLTLHFWMLGPSRNSWLSPALRFPVIVASWAYRSEVAGSEAGSVAC
jgi:hypothetical protein